MVMRYGFSDKLGNVVYGHDPQQTFLGRDYGQGQGYSDAVANEIDNEIRRLVDEGYNRCMKILQDNIDKLHIVAKILMKKEKIDGEEFAKIMADGYVYVEDEEIAENAETAVLSDAENTAETADVETTSENCETLAENSEDAVESAEEAHSAEENCED